MQFLTAALKSVRLTEYALYTNLLVSKDAMGFKHTHIYTYVYLKFLFCVMAIHKFYVFL